MNQPVTDTLTESANGTPKLQKGLGLLDSSMLIMGSMIGSGIFIVSADMARQLQSPGMLLLAWIVTGILTIFGALSYGELAAMMPKAGGQYIYLKEAYSRLMGFLYGWTLFGVIQTGTIAAVAVAFAKFAGVFWPGIASTNVLLDLGFMTFSTQQLVAILCIWALTLLNFREVSTGALVQNILTFAKVGALLMVILLGLWLGFRQPNVGAHFETNWPDTVDLNLIGLFFVAMVGSAFSADAWNNITFTAGEVRNPQRNLPLSLLIGTGVVIGLYLLANVAYLAALTFQEIQTADQDRVGTLLMQKLLGPAGLYAMAALIMVSTFGCLNGIILTGGRVYYAMAKDRLFFPQAARLNKNGVPANSLVFQALWASLLTLSGSYGDLLDYVMFAVLLFYIFTVIGLFILRKKRPEWNRPYRVVGYPLVPIIYILLAAGICISLLVYKPQYSFSGLGIVLLGIPVYYVLKGTLAKGVDSDPQPGA